MRLHPYLQFDGTCSAAFAFYETALGAKISMSMNYGEAPPDSGLPPGAEHLVMHMQMEVAGTVLMGCDTPPGRGEPVQGCSMSLSMTEPAEAERVFAALSEGGTVTMPLAETFWAKRFGMLKDKFGVPWMVNCE